MSTRRLVTLLGFLGLIALTMRYAPWADTWWHLGIGRWMTEHGRLPSSNALAHTFPDLPWKYTEWSFGLLLYDKLAQSLQQLGAG